MHIIVLQATAVWVDYKEQKNGRKDLKLSREQSKKGVHTFGQMKILHYPKTERSKYLSSS